MSRIRQLRTRTAIAVGAVIAATFLPATILPAASANADDGDRHCVVNVDTGILACAGDQAMTLDQARARAAGAGLNSAPADAPEAATVAVRVATIYTGFLGGGDSLEINASSDCTSSRMNVDWTLGNVGSMMNDRVSSVRVYGNCLVQLFDDAGCPPGSDRFPTVGWAGTTNYVGEEMNDRTTCVRGS